MCDVQAKLVAWMDHELTTEQAGAVERHLEICHECRLRVGTYERVRQAFDAYCDAVMAARAPRRSLWVPALAGALVAAAVVCVALLRRQVVQPAVIEPTAALASASDPVPPPVAEPIQHKPMIRRRHPAPQLRGFAPESPMDAAVEIAIPAEAMFPPGVMPNGVNFIADLRIAPDGSVKQVRLRQ